MGQISPMTYLLTIETFHQTIVTLRCRVRGLQRVDVLYGASAKASRGQMGPCNVTGREVEERGMM